MLLCKCNGHDPLPKSNSGPMEMYPPANFLQSYFEPQLLERSSLSSWSSALFVSLSWLPGRRKSGSGTLLFGGLRTSHKFLHRLSGSGGRTLWLCCWCQRSRIRHLVRPALFRPGLHSGTMFFHRIFEPSEPFTSAFGG